MAILLCCLPWWTSNQFWPFQCYWRCEDALKHLQMHNEDRIMKYMVQFNQYASQVGYGNNSLRHAFYRGLCTHIKDDMAHHRKPNNLRNMRFLAQELDAHYWTQRTKISRENWENKSSGSYSNNPKSKGSNSNPSSLTSGSAPKSSNSNSSGSASNPKPYADKLGKDGRLTQEEKDRHRKNNLCMFCGGKHKTEDCNKRKAVLWKLKNPFLPLRIWLQQSRKTRGQPCILCVRSGLHWL